MRKMGQDKEGRKTRNKTLDVIRSELNTQDEFQMLLHIPLVKEIHESVSKPWRK